MDRLRFVVSEAHVCVSGFAEKLEGGCDLSAWADLGDELVSMVGFGRNTN